jgi:hypothetical protein
MKRTLIALALLSLAACGGGSGGAGGSAGFDSPGAVAKAGGCDSPAEVKNADLEMMVTSAVTCQKNGHELIVNWFKSDTALKNYRSTADQFGGAGLAYGDNFAVECNDDQADCDAFMKAAK